MSLSWLKYCVSIQVLLAGMSLMAADDVVPDSVLTQDLHEVVVTGNAARQRLENAQLGAERLELSRLVKVPSLGGENDIIKSIALLPGVRSENDGGGGFEVRGGNASQNLITLDGMTLYNPSHVMGIFSTFNDNALLGATLYKGPFPAPYGGATASVLETTLAPGDASDYHAAATVGILAAKIKLEGPILKDKLSMAVNARRSYVDAFLKMVPQYRGTIMNFYDVSAKVRYSISRRHTLDGSFFISRDNMAIRKVMGLYWGNIASSLTWIARPDERVSVTTTASLTHSNPIMEMTMMSLDQSMHSYIHTYNINSRTRWELSQSHSIEAGVRSELFKVMSAQWEVNMKSEREMRSVWENSMWVDYVGHAGDKLDISAGLRANLSTVPGGHRFHAFESLGDAVARFDPHTYFNVEPRASVKYNISPLHNIKAGGGTSTQNIHSIRSSATSFPFDRCALTSATVKPERATHMGLGYTGMTESGDYDWQAEGFFRHIDNVYDYKDGCNTFSNINLEEIILGGRGRSYGAEFMIRKNTGRLTGWIAYTLSHTQTRIPGINNDRWYNATNDRRHDLSATVSLQLNKSWALSGAWIFLSGQPLTAPDVKYEIAGQTCYYHSQRNAYRTPSTHRLDLSATYTHTGRRVTYQWAFGVYNAYCRYNPYVVYFEDDPSKPSGTRAVLHAMYGLIPSVSYTIKF